MLNPATMQLNNPEAVRQSEKNCGLVEAFAANTNQGIVRNYNEDRVSIILNVNKPATRENLNGLLFASLGFSMDMADQRVPTS